METTYTDVDFFFAIWLPILFHINPHCKIKKKKHYARQWCKLQHWKMLRSIFTKNIHTDPLLFTCWKRGNDIQDVETKIQPAKTNMFLVIVDQCTVKNTKRST